jgi:phosphoglycolate phosphatase-like HAD superfamily hydrolase
LFICTGTPETEIRIILDKKGLTKYFKGIYGAPKNKADIIQEIIHTYRFSNKELEFYGDAMTDYNAAKATNIKFTGVFSTTTSFPEGTLVIKDFINN